MQKAKVFFLFYFLLLMAGQPLSAQITMVKDINAGANDALFPAYQQILKLGSLLYFPADDGVHGRELWKSNGVSSGTNMVIDLNSAPGVGSDPDQLTVIGNRLFFVADDGVHGPELWVINGGNPPQLLELEPGLAGATVISSIIGVGSDVYFLATTPTYGGELWKYDGINQPSVIEAAIGAAGTDPAYLFYGNNHIWGHWDELAYDPTNSTLYWVGTVPSQFSLWKYQIGSSVAPSAAGSFQSVYAQLQPLVALNGHVYFPAYGNSGFQDTELYQYDGTSISLFHEFIPGSGGGFPYHMTLFNGNIFFLAKSQTSFDTYRIWKIAGTNQIDAFPFGSNAFYNSGTFYYSTDGYPSKNPFLILDGNLYVQKSNQVWKLNSTGLQFNGPVLTNFQATINGIGLVKTGSKFFYRGWASDSNPQIFYHNGTGATAISSFDGTCDCFMGQLTLRGNRLYFPALTVAKGWELWKLDPAQYFSAPDPELSEREAVQDNAADSPAPFVLGPNPADASCTIHFEAPTAEGFNLAVYDNAGKKVLEAVLPAGVNEYSIPTASLPKGLYFIQLRGEKTSQSFEDRMVVSR